MSTEGKLWDAMYRQAVDFPKLMMTRFELGLTLGISDVEYVGTRMHGWIELKVGKITQRGAEEFHLVLNEPLKPEQQIWLVSHNRPPSLRSWVLVGIPTMNNKHRWGTFLLLTPALAIAVEHRKLTFAKLHKHKDFLMFPALATLMEYIA